MVVAALEELGREVVVRRGQGADVVPEGTPFVEGAADEGDVRVVGEGDGARGVGGRG